MKYGTFMPYLGLGRKGQMKIAATWKLRDNVTLTLPPKCADFPKPGTRCWPVVQVSAHCEVSSWSNATVLAVLLSLLPLLHSSRMVLRTCSSWRQARAGEGLST